MDYSKYFLKLDEVLFPYLYKKPNLKLLSIFTPFTLDGFNKDILEFNKHIEDFNKVNTEIRTIIDYNNKVLLNEVPLDSFGVTGSFEAVEQTNSILGMSSNKVAYFVCDVIYKTFLLVWNNLFPVVKWLCLIVALVGIILSVAGDPLGKKLSIRAIVVYVICKLIDIIVRGGF